MKMYIRLSLLIFLVWVIVFETVTVNADQESSVIPYALESSDKKYVFIMLGESPFNNSPSPKFKDRNKSGLYLNNGSIDPLWVVDWTAYTFLPSDGVHIIRRGSWARLGDYGAEAISFFANGKILKSYSVRDLVDFPQFLPRTSSHYKWQKKISNKNQVLELSNTALVEADVSVEFNESAHTMQLATLQGDIYIFDVNTGEIVSSKHPVRIILITLITFLFLIFIFSIFWLKRKSKNSHLAK